MATTVTFTYKDTVLTLTRPDRGSSIEYIDGFKTFIMKDGTIRKTKYPKLITRLHLVLRVMDTTIYDLIEFFQQVLNNKFTYTDELSEDYVVRNISQPFSVQQDQLNNPSPLTCEKNDITITLESVADATVDV